MNQPLDLLSIIPATNETARQTLLDYIRTAPIAPDHWKVLKTIYKQYEAKPDAAITAAIIVKLDQSPITELQVTYPTRKTMAYMKRRARRFMKSITDVRLYEEIASQVILANEGESALHFDYQWISADIILGNSNRMVQQGHGRGKVVFDGMCFHYHRIEERHPQIWNQRIDFMQSLLTRHFPWPIQEFALKILLRNRQAVPEFSPTQLDDYFDAPSLWLKRVACQQVYAMFCAGKRLSAKEWAGLYMYGTIAQRRELLQGSWAQQSNAWLDEVTAIVCSHILHLAKNGKPSRRVMMALQFLHDFMKDRLDATMVVKIARLLLQSGQKNLEEWAFTTAGKASRDQALAWFATTSLDHQLARLVQVFAPKFRNNKLDTSDLEPFIFHPSFVVCQFGWELVEKNSRHVYHNIEGIWAKLVKGIGKPAAEKSLFHTLQSGTAASLFVQYYTNYEYHLSNNEFFPWNAYAFILEHGSEQYTKFLFQKLLQWFTDQPLLWLPLVSQCSEKIRKDIMQRTLPAIRTKRLFNTSLFIHAITNVENPDNEWFWKTLFHIMDVSIMPKEDAGNVFQLAAQNIHALIHLIKATPSLTDTQKRQWFLEETGHLLANRPELIADANGDLAVMLLNSIPGEGLISIIPAINDNSWPRFREIVHQRIKSMPQPGVFWRNALQQTVDSEKGDILIARIFREPSLFTLFVEQATPEILDVQHPSVEEFIDQWLQKHPNVFTQNTSLLYKACIHKLPVVRDRALSQVMALGMDVSFMVRLMESDLPPTRQAVYQYMESLELGSPKEWDAMLAMCDSPNPATRTFGIQFLQARKNQWPAERREQLLEFLSEHADPEIHRLVSEELLAQTVEKSFVTRFDKEVLRMKNRSRKAKENIKQREEKNHHLSSEVLLEMARSKQKQDAQWAIWQLTKRTLAGEEIKGFTLN